MPCRVPYNIAISTLTCTPISTNSHIFSVRYLQPPILYYSGSYISIFMHYTHACTTTELESTESSRSFMAAYSIDMQASKHASLFSIVVPPS